MCSNQFLINNQALVYFFEESVLLINTTYCSSKTLFRVDLKSSVLFVCYTCFLALSAIVVWFDTHHSRTNELLRWQRSIMNYSPIVLCFSVWHELILLVMLFRTANPVQVGVWFISPHDVRDDRKQTCSSHTIFAVCKMYTHIMYLFTGNVTYCIYQNVQYTWFISFMSQWT